MALSDFRTVVLNTTFLISNGCTWGGASAGCATPASALPSAINSHSSISGTAASSCRAASSFASKATPICSKAFMTLFASASHPIESSPEATESSSLFFPKKSYSLSGDVAAPPSSSDDSNPSIGLMFLARAAELAGGLEMSSTVERDDIALARVTTT